MDDKSPTLRLIEWCVSCDLGVIYVLVQVQEVQKNPKEGKKQTKEGILRMKGNDKKRLSACIVNTEGPE